MKLDKRHPIGRHLVGCWFPYKDPAMMNIVNNHELSTIGSGATSVRKLENGGMRLDNACSIKTNNTQPSILSDGDYFWFIRFRLRALINVNHTVFGNRLGGTSSPLQFVKFYEGGFQYYNNASGPTMAFTRAAETERTVLVVKRNADWKMYLNGELHATATAAVSMDPNPIYIGSGDVNAFYENTNIRFYFGMHGPVAPSPAQVASLFANPEQVLYSSYNQTFYESTATPPATDTAKNLLLMGVG